MWISEDPRCPHFKRPRKKATYTHFGLLPMADNLIPLSICALFLGATFTWIYYIRRGDRMHIRANVESQGGTVVEILKHWGSGLGGRYQRAYDVVYTKAGSGEKNALCLIGFRRRVYWITDRLP
jgi:hypothetical protein